MYVKIDKLKKGEELETETEEVIFPSSVHRSRRRRLVAAAAAAATASTSLPSFSSAFSSLRRLHRRLSTTTSSVTTTSLPGDRLQERQQVLPFEHGERRPFAHDGHRRVFAVELALGQRRRQGAQPRPNELVGARARGLVPFDVALQQRLGRLRAGADRRGAVGVRVPGRAQVMQRRLAALLAPPGHQQAHAEGPLPRPLRGDLGPVGQRAHQPPGGQPALVDEAVRGALRAHRPEQAAAVADEARDGDAEVVVDLEDLGLVGRELRGGALEGGEDGVG